MVKRLAATITQYCISHNWIECSKSQWCQYAAEKILGKLAFSWQCLLLGILTGRFCEMIVFVLTFYAFRERMGGWHANHFWSCQILSVAITVSAVIFFGPCLEGASLLFSVTINIIIVLLTCCSKPAYPVAVHFTAEIKYLNTKKKNRMLIGLVVFQIFTLIVCDSTIFVYSLLALAFTDFSVLLQYIKLQKERMCET